MLSPRDALGHVTDPRQAKTAVKVDHFAPHRVAPMSSPYPPPRVPRLACLSCRSKKHKCSLDRPVCARCNASGEICQWPEGRKPRQRLRGRDVAVQGTSRGSVTLHNRLTTPQTLSVIPSDFESHPGAEQQRHSSTAPSNLERSSGLASATRVAERDVGGWGPYTETSLPTNATASTTVALGNDSWHNYSLPASANRSDPASSVLNIYYFRSVRVQLFPALQD
jgi:hypothetical protein